MSTAWRNALHYILLFGSTGVSLPFAGLWFQSQGLNGAEIGTLLAAPMLARLVTGPMIAVWADSFAYRRTAIAILSVIAALGYGAAGLVERMGMRFLSHLALFGFTGMAALHVLIAATGHEVMWTFIALQAATMGFFGLIPGNFGAMAMQPLGHIAGTASSVQGLITTVGGALIGFFIGQQYDGSTLPMSLGFVVCGLGALAFVLWAEKGRLFRRHDTA